MRLINADGAIKLIREAHKSGPVNVEKIINILEMLAASSFFDKKLEEEKELVWLDDDQYTVGYNAGIDHVISLLKERD